MYAFDFELKTQVVSVRCGKLITKAEKGWEKDKQKGKMDRHLICIEDPVPFAPFPLFDLAKMQFELDVDLGRNVDEDTLPDLTGFVYPFTSASTPLPSDEFRRGYNVMAQTGDINLLCAKFSKPAISRSPLKMADPSESDSSAESSPRPAADQ